MAVMTAGRTALEKTWMTTVKVVEVGICFLGIELLKLSDSNLLHSLVSLCTKYEKVASNATFKLILFVHLFINWTFNEH